MTGLQANLYLRSMKQTFGWDGQSPPTPKHQKGKPVYNFGKSLPQFGVYKKELEKLIANKKKSELKSNGHPNQVIREVVKREIFSPEDPILKIKVIKLAGSFMVY